MMIEAQVTYRTKAIENGFPIGFISRLAEHESWRKEVYRPVYYIHKWWARRLGSVFRGIILGSSLEWDQNIEELFYTPVDLSDITVFDPFMGSGTTIGEAAKLGCRVIGRDINPVAFNLVKTALQQYDIAEIDVVFQHLSKTVGEKIRSLYSVMLPNGERADVLYYFWVKVIPCPLCGHEVELHKSRIFSQNAAPTKRSEAKSICPKCESINGTFYNAEQVTCDSCHHAYNPQIGNFQDKKVECPSCRATFTVISVVRNLPSPPKHKLFAKMILDKSGNKVYLPIDKQDRIAYENAEKMLEQVKDKIPHVQIQPGYNTNQILNYQYRYWDELFNARQLLALGLLMAEIEKIENSKVRSLFATLFSSVLEFNNIFCSFKGEGTGAVRPIFANHILKPELTPLEANVWGTHKSSGSFSTLYESRIVRALEYKNAPFEFKVIQVGNRQTNEKVFDLCAPMNFDIADDFSTFVQNGKSVYLSVGDSANTDLPDQSVDAVITDPPFFDNVHYSELADFFHVWLNKFNEQPSAARIASTRSINEVQDINSKNFASKLTSVFRECNRVLKDDGIFIFTYHHSRMDGWIALYKAIREAGFCVTHTHPIKAEMAVSIPIMQSKSPINFDLIVSCRKDILMQNTDENEGVPLLVCERDTQKAIAELREAQIDVSIGDVKVIFFGCLLSRLGNIRNTEKEIDFLENIELTVDKIVANIFENNTTNLLQSQSALAF